MSAEWAAVVVAVVGLGFVFWQVWLARKALEDGVKALKFSDVSNRLSREMFVLELRNSISLARTELSDAAHAVHQAPENEQHLSRLNERREEFLNRMDHLCRSFRLGFVDERDYQPVYFDELKKLMNECPDSFKPGHMFPNIQIVFERWRDRQPARDPDRVDPGRAVE